VLEATWMVAYATDEPIETGRLVQIESRAPVSIV
jgi:hypothetical protein